MKTRKRYYVSATAIVIENRKTIYEIANWTLHALCTPPDNRQYLRWDASLEVKRKDNQNCCVLCCVQQLCTVTRTQM